MPFMERGTEFQSESFPDDLEELSTITTVCARITSCPQLVSVPLTGLERTLSSSLNMDLSLPSSEGFTCLTAIAAVVVELARRFTMPRSVFIQCLGIRGSQRQTSNKNG
ncbi:hypothetical protein AVEN_188743-1 [Araneus ventricosus]|uniref:Uncharacterized protein n=1 Tax=Araneus ventricosus TaxID=182803 RepID=A0A4Y2U3H2_ARAVE|nr:hypothetical protein AVEN_188743-1 [Araneus ventricosus]